MLEGENNSLVGLSIYIYIYYMVCALERRESKERKEMLEGSREWGVINIYMCGCIVLKDKREKEK